MNIFALGNTGLDCRAVLFPIFGMGRYGWTWREVLKFSKFTLWMLVLGNLTFGGMMTLTFGVASVRLVIDPETYSDVLKHPQILVFDAFVLAMAVLGVTALLGAVRLVVYLAQERGRG